MNSLVTTQRAIRLANGLILSLPAPATYEEIYLKFRNLAVSYCGWEYNYGHLVNGQFVTEDE